MGKAKMLKTESGNQRGVGGGGLKPELRSKGEKKGWLPVNFFRD